jgi:hypothetical protein
MFRAKHPLGSCCRISPHKARFEDDLAEAFRV